jgi:phospholipase/carboxylesterase
MLINPEGLKEEGIVKPRILAIHGADDAVVPPQCLEGVSEGFTVAGFDVETILRPRLGHGIDQFSLIYGLEFIQKAFEMKT